MNALAVLAGALFFIGDIYVLRELFKRLFALVLEANAEGGTGGEASPADPASAAGSGEAAPLNPAPQPYAHLEPVSYDDRPATGSPPKAQLIILVILKFILLVPVLLALLYVFEAQAAYLFVGMLLGLVVICALLYFKRQPTR